ncbi:MAG: M48 family metallopeptidase [Candidatus Shapirobacteria bacterium]
MQNVYEQVSANKTRSDIVIILFIGFIILAAYAITVAFELDPSVLAIAAIFSIVSAVGSFYFGDKIILSLNGARLADRKEFFDYYTVVENLSLANQSPMPQIYVIDSPAPNAFATGRDPEHAVVCATTGLLQKLNRTELEGVIGHELSHVKNYDIRLMMIVSMLIGSLSILTNMVQRNRFFGSRRRDNDSSINGLLAILGVFLLIFAPLIGKLIQLAISRRREFLADASSVKLTRQPQGLIDALKKISSDPNALSSASTATASLYISNPFKDNKLASLFSTHPPILDRIKALESML